MATETTTKQPKTDTKANGKQPEQPKQEATQTAEAEAAKTAAAETKAAEAAAKAAQKEREKAERAAKREEAKQANAAKKEAEKATRAAAREAKKAEREAASQPKPCGCGRCDQQTRGRFATGHDAKFFARVKGLVEGTTPMDDANDQEREAIAKGEFGHGSFKPRWNALAGESAPEKLRKGPSRKALEEQLTKAEARVAELREKLNQLPAETPESTLVEPQA